MRQTLVIQVSGIDRMKEKVRALKARNARLAVRKAQEAESQWDRHNLPLAS